MKLCEIHRTFPEANKDEVTVDIRRGLKEKEQAANLWH